MADLIAKSPCEGLLPSTIGSVTLSEVWPDRITFVAPLQSQTNAVSSALKEALGIAFPKPNRSPSKGDARAIWVGPGQAFVVADTLPDLTGQAAVTDQTDGVAIVAISGADAEAVLARLVPVDLRRATFKTGHTARTLINHMAGSVTRTGANSFEVMVMRSMARTLVAELSEAAHHVDLRRSSISSASTPES